MRKGKSHVHPLILWPCLGLVRTERRIRHGKVVGERLGGRHTRLPVTLDHANLVGCFHAGRRSSPPTPASSSFAPADSLRGCTPPRILSRSPCANCLSIASLCQCCSFKIELASDLNPALSLFLCRSRADARRRSACSRSSVEQGF